MVLEGQSKTDLQHMPKETTTFEVDSRNWIVYSQLLLTMFLWGLAWPVGRLLAIDLPPVSIAALRYAIVVPVLFGILKIKGQPIRLERKWIASLVIMGLFSTTLYQVFFLYGVRYLGFISGLAGIGVISLLSPNTAVLNRPLGISLVFGGAVAYAIYTVTLRRFMGANRADNTSPAPSSLAILAWISLFGWVFLIPLSLSEAPWTYSWSPVSWLGIVYLALLSTVVGYFFYVEGVSKIGAGRAAIFGNLVPVFGVITSVLLLPENLSPWHGVSFLLILAGVVLVNKQKKMGQTGRR